MRFNGNRHRAMMAMAATGVLTALAPSAPALADTEAQSTSANNVVVADVGIRTAVGDKVVEAAYAELNSDHRWETPMGSSCNFYSSRWNKPCQDWCADFVKYVWKNAGVYAWESLDSEAGTAARWGRFFSAWHWGTAGIYPGAAVTYNRAGDPFVDSDHVGIFVGWVNGAPKVISGNFSNQVYKHNLNYSSERPIAGWTGV